MKLNDLSITFHTGKIKECVDFYVRYFDVKVTFDCEWYVTIQFQSDVNPFYFSFVYETRVRIGGNGIYGRIDFELECC